MNTAKRLRDRLREATQAAHERLHRHAGFAAAARGDITRDDYRLLLARLYGFHHPFECATAARATDFSLDLAERRRAPLLVQDLASLGVDAITVERLPLCGEEFGWTDAAALLGALYVTEGSTLGGVLIARALARVATDARRFYLGHGERNGEMWRNFVARLEAIEDDAGQAAAIASAQRTFLAFENWMNGWKSLHRDDGAGATPCV